MSLPVVAIVGRPNVGKSSLFNRIVGKRIAVIDEIAGVTRDRHYASADWAGKYFRIIDTGGIVPRTNDVMELHIHDQVDLAMNEADLVLLIVDARAGLTDVDKEVAQDLRRHTVPSLLFVNKVDGSEQEAACHEFYALGLSTPNPVSAMTGRGMGDALDALVAFLPENVEEVEDDSIIRVALLGKPNVGKSSITNKLLRRGAMIVDSKPGTTRDAVDTPLTVNGRPFSLIDTAGLRRKIKVWKTGDAVEYYSNLRTERALERCQVAAVLMDAREPLTRQDMDIVQRVNESGKAMLFVVNKWDLVPKDTSTMGEWVTAMKEQLPQTAYFPILFTSAETGQRVDSILQSATEVFEQWNRRIETTVLNEFLQELMHVSPPRGGKSGRLKLNYITQVSVAPPVFVIFLSRPEKLPEDYRRFLERQIRETYGFVGTPLRFIFRGKHDGDGPSDR